MAREHPRDVAVDHGLLSVEGDGADRASRVAAHPREPEAVFGARRDLASIACDHIFDTGVEKSRTAIVSEAAPVAHHLVFGGFRQRRGCRKARHEALVVGHDGVHACLLTHDLAHPDRVGIASAPPGQVTPVGVVPSQQLRARLLGFHRGEHEGGRTSGKGRMWFS